MWRAGSDAVGQPEHGLASDAIKAATSRALSGSVVVA